MEKFLVREGAWVSEKVNGFPLARQKNVLSQSAYLFTLSNYQSNHAKDNRK